MDDGSDLVTVIASGRRRSEPGIAREITTADDLAEAALVYPPHAGVLGFAKPGEGVTLFENGRSTPGGTLPINTNGGGLSYAHFEMYGIFPIFAAARQLRGECGA